MSDIIAELGDIRGKDKKTERMADSQRARSARRRTKPIIKQIKLNEAQEDQARREAAVAAAAARRAKAKKGPAPK